MLHTTMTTRTYFGRLGRKQHHHTFRSRGSATRYAEKALQPCTQNDMNVYIRPNGLLKLRKMGDRLWLGCRTRESFR